MQIVKSLYEPKQAAKQWHENFDRILTFTGFVNNEIDMCVYYWHDGEDDIVVLEHLHLASLVIALPVWLLGRPIQKRRPFATKITTVYQTSPITLSATPPRPRSIRTSVQVPDGHSNPRHVELEQVSDNPKRIHFGWCRTKFRECLRGRYNSFR